MSLVGFGIPQVIKDMSVSIDDNFHMGDIQQVVLPKIVKKIEDYRTGFSTVPIELGIEALETSITMIEHTRNLFLKMGIIGGAFGDVIVFRASQEGSSALLDRTNIKITMKGTFTEIDLGTVERGNISSFKLTAKLTHFAYFMDNNPIPLILIEPITQTFMVNGVDQLALRKKALGII